MSPGPSLPIDAGLWERFREAGPRIAWRAAPRSRPKARIAHLHDEEARVELNERAGSAVLRVDSGPVGALVILLEIDRRGTPAFVGAADASGPPFPSGSLVARWGDAPALPSDRSIPIRDLVELARYALV